MPGAAQSKDMETPQEPQTNDENAINVYPAFRDILLAICSKQRLTIQDETTTPADVIRIYQKNGVMKYWWHEVLWAQLAQNLRLKYQNKDEMSEEKAQKDIHTLLKEIIDVWNLFLQRYGALPSSMSVHSDVPGSSPTLPKPQGFPKHG